METDKSPKGPIALVHFTLYTWYTLNILTFTFRPLSFNFLEIALTCVLLWYKPGVITGV